MPNSIPFFVYAGKGYVLQLFEKIKRCVIFVEINYLKQ